MWEAIFGVQGDVATDRSGTHLSSESSHGNTQAQASAEPCHLLNDDLYAGLRGAEDLCL